MSGEDVQTHTCSIPCHIDPADPARGYWLIDREVSSAACYLVDVVMVGVQEGARALLKGIREGQDDSKKPTVEQAFDR